MIEQDVPRPLPLVDSQERHFDVTQYPIIGLVPSNPEWDDKAQNYRVSIEGNTPVAIGKRERLHGLLEEHDVFRPGLIIAEFGGGPGVLLPEMHDKIGNTGHIYQVDASHNMLVRARQKASDLSIPPWQIDFIQGNESITGIPEQSCNLVMAFNTIAHLDMEKFLEECARVLSSEGQVIIMQSMSRTRLAHMRRGNDPLPYEDNLRSLLGFFGLRLVTFVDKYIADPETDDGYYFVRAQRDEPIAA